MIGFGVETRNIYFPIFTHGTAPHGRRRDENFSRTTPISVHRYPTTMTDPTRLVIGNLSFSTTDESLKAAFEAHGTVTDAKVIVDRYTHRSKGYGFVAFSTAEEASAAMTKMNGVEVDGRPVRVDHASSRQN